jgi:pectate lyase
MAHHKIALKLLLAGVALMVMNAAAGCSGLAGMHAVSAQELAVETWAYGLPDIAESITDGGRGGEIIHVTTLDSEGPGSLRAALDMEGPRIIVFDVAGAIDLAGNSLRIRNSDVTIAGQTAPSPGVTILRGGMVIGANDVIVQHIRIRPGDFGEAPRSGRDVDAITTSSAHNVIVDHCTLSWATDENLSASGPRFTGETPDDWREGTSKNILFSNNIIAEGLSHSTHAKGEHSKGSLIHDNVSDIIIYANLYSSNYERSPLFKGGVHGALVNNFIYNPGQRAIHYNLQGLEWGEVPPTVGEMDLVANVMRAGPSTADGLPLVMFGGEGPLSLYMDGNEAVDRWGEPAPVSGRYTVSGSGVESSVAPHMDLSGLPVLSAEAVEAHVLANAGARPWDRDVNDVRVLADAAEGRGGIIDSQEEVGGYPEFEEQTRPFNAADWDLESMSPRSGDALDSAAGARGT